MVQLAHQTCKIFQLVLKVLNTGALERILAAALSFQIQADQNVGRRRHLADGRALMKKPIVGLRQSIFGVCLRRQRVHGHREGKDRGPRTSSQSQLDPSMHKKAGKNQLPRKARNKNLETAQYRHDFYLPEEKCGKLEHLRSRSNQVFGNSNEIVVPTFSSLWTCIWPPCISAMLFAIERPSPVPP